MVLEYAKGRRGGVPPAVATARRGLEVITWRSIGDAGEESEAIGCVWAPAPAWGGRRAVWVRTLLGCPPPADPTLIDYPLDEADFGPTVLVVSVHRRVRARVVGRGGRFAWGRWVERGERWNDAEMRAWARDAAGRGGPTSIPGVRTVQDEIDVAAWQEEPSWVLQFEPERLATSSVK